MNTRENTVFKGNMQIVFPEVFVPLQIKEKEIKRDEKYDVSLSEDGLTYTLKIKDVKVTDTGDYTISIGDLTATVPLFIERKDFMGFTIIKNFLYVFFCYVLFFPKGQCLPVLVELAFHSIVDKHPPTDSVETSSYCLFFSTEIRHVIPS